MGSWVIVIIIVIVVIVIVIVIDFCIVIVIDCCIVIVIVMLVFMGCWVCGGRNRSPSHSSSRSMRVSGCVTVIMPLIFFVLCLLVVSSLVLLCLLFVSFLFVVSHCCYCCHYC